MSEQPLVSIGLPVYNEAAHLRRALDSWLRQEYRDFELILSDNASTDNTLEICREYAARDPRILLLEQPVNIGTYRNHREVFESSRGKYFIWAGGHDYVHSALLVKTLDALRSNPGLALCTFRSEFRDENDVCWRTPEGGLDLRGQSPSQRFAGMIRHMTSGGTSNVFYGLYNREIVSRVVDLKKCFANDNVMLSQVALLGDVFQLDDVLYYRFLQQGIDRRERMLRLVNIVFGENSLEPDARLPYLGYLSGYSQVIEESGLEASERQSMFETVMDEARRIQKTLGMEFSAFVREGGRELSLYEGFPGIRRYRAMKVLEGLNRAKAFGLESGEAKRLRRQCEKILKIKRDAALNPDEDKTTPLPFFKPKAFPRKIPGFFLKVKKYFKLK